MICFLGHLTGHCCVEDAGLWGKASNRGQQSSHRLALGRAQMPSNAANIDTGADTSPAKAVNYVLRCILSTKRSYLDICA